MSQSTDVLDARIDTWANSDLPSKNYADGPHLGLKSASGYAYLRFNLPRAFDPTADRTITVMSAVLHLYTRGSWGVTPTLTAKRVTEEWGPQHVTWNNKPAVGGTGATVSHSSAADGDEFAIDVTTQMQTVANSGDWFGLRVETSNGTLRYVYSSSAANEAFAPTLELTWSEAPQQPTALRPSGGRSVSVAKPVVQCDFDDRIGSTQMQAINVQVNATNVWTSPTFDSGAVAATVPELDLSTTAYAGLSNGSSTWWRVRVQDGSGLWSNWSDGSQFRRDSKGTLTISNPAASPNNFVTEWTPEIVWSLTGATQKAWQIEVAPDDDRTSDLWDSGRNKGTDVSRTLPKAILEDDGSYYLTVRVWDTADREHTPGDPPWTEANRSFTVNESGTVGHVTGLALSRAVALAPWVQVEWDRSTAPDSYTVRRQIGSGDWKTIETGIDPADVLASGTHYSWRDKSAPTNRNLTYKVVSVVNHATSNANPTATINNPNQGVWITDLDSDVDVFVATEDGALSAQSSDQATMFAPLGSSRQIRITQGLRGLEGTVAGNLVTAAGDTADGWRDKLARIQGHPTHRMRLSVGGQNIPCIVGDIVVFPLQYEESVWSVSFGFWQTGSLDFKFGS